MADVITTRIYKNVVLTLVKHFNDFEYKLPGGATTKTFFEHFASIDNPCGTYSFNSGSILLGFPTDLTALVPPKIAIILASMDSPELMTFSSEIYDEPMLILLELFCGGSIDDRINALQLIDMVTDLRHAVFNEDHIDYYNYSLNPAVPTLDGILEISSIRYESLGGGGFVDAEKHRGRIELDCKITRLAEFYQ